MYAPMTFSFVLIHSPNPCVQSIKTSPEKKHRPEAVEAEGDASTTSTEARIGDGQGVWELQIRSQGGRSMENLDFQDTFS